MKKRLANWGNYPVMVAEEYSFAFEDQLPSILRQGSPLIARGNGRCYGDASLETHAVSTLQYDKILFFDENTGVITTEAGITLDQVLKLIVPQGWFLPVTPGTQFITIGGAVASDVHGKNHHVDGSFSRHVLKMDIMLESGEILTCSRTEHPDLFAATCGGMGLTGIILRVSFQLKKIETAYIRQTQIKAGNLDELLILFEKYSHVTYSVAWIDCLEQGKHFGRSILMLGEHAKKEALPDAWKAQALCVPQSRAIRFPFYLPSFVLNRFTVKTFNQVYYAKNRKKESHDIIPYLPFFYPLDAILEWNKGYGKRGFVQYQFVLPLEAKEGLVRILQMIGKEGMGSFLAVLKIFGEQDDLIAFPMKGYTLALDFPVTQSLFPFLDQLDELVLQYGGRIYLSKDARMKGSSFRQSYPHADEFLSIIRKYNPQQQFQSVQARRLGLIS